MSDVAQDRRGFPVLMTLFTALALALLIGLGVWQVKRLHWKEALLDRIAAVQSAPAEPLDVVLRRMADPVAPVDGDYTRVQADCPDIERTGFIKLWSVTEAGGGFRIITACRLDAAPFASILVDRGFVTQAAAPNVAPSTAAPLTQPVIGILRRGDAPNFATAKNDPGAGLWYWRDIPAMAKALGASDPAPTFLMLEQPAPRTGLPAPAPLPVNIPNNHLGYAITWFGLAAALAGVYLASLWRRLRR